MDDAISEIDKEITRLVQEGLTPLGIGARLNLPEGEVKRRLQEIGYPARRRGWFAQAIGAQALRRQIIEAHFAGKTPAEIADEYEWDLGYIVRRLHEADLVPHTDPEAIERAKKSHEEILALGRQGIPRHEIAKHLEVPWLIVANTLDQAKIKPLLPACTDIAGWARTLTPILDEIRGARPNDKPILEKVDKVERELVAITEAAAKAGELMAWAKGNSERWCLSDISSLANASLALVDVLKGCVEQREVAVLPRLLDQAETCIKNASTLMTKAISAIGEE